MKCNTVHNHDIGPHLAKHYPSNRHLNSIECQEVLTLLEVGGNATLVRNYIEKKTGKFLTNQDIRNMKMKFSNSCEESKVVLLKKFVEMDESNVACIVLDDEKNIEIIFLQSRKQCEWFDKFSELIILDGTNKINNAGMTLYDVLVEDGFGSSCVVAYCFVAQETKVSLVNFLQIFWTDVKVTLTDKDMTEIVPLNEELPQSTNLLCRFHMLKYFRSKIATYSCSKETKEQLMQLAKRMVYALSVDDMNQVVAEIESISPLFHEYLSKNWLSCKGTGAPLNRKSYLQCATANQ
uniref:ZSWIM1/3 RNaseH-like domain-containing protein n=1 Tax=Amphimedon queenslandica TaxID=400682 RepID=A0A1X7VHU1_AMPQE